MFYTGKESSTVELDHAPETVASNEADLSSQQLGKANKVETAGKIRALLTEIGSSKLVTPNGEPVNFHPCPWCSGRLINV